MKKEKDFYKRRPMLGTVFNYFEWLGLFVATAVAAKAGVTYAELDPEIAGNIKGVAGGVAFLAGLFGVPAPSRWFNGDK